MPARRHLQLLLGAGQSPSGGPPGASRKWAERTPAMAAGLTDHRWSLQELLRYQVPLAAAATPKRRGRPPTCARPLALAVAA